MSVPNSPATPTLPSSPLCSEIHTDSGEGKTGVYYSFVLFSYNEIIITKYLIELFVIGNDSGLTPWRNMMNENLVNLVKSGLYNDTRLQYKDGELFSPRALVALCLPYTYYMLRDTIEDEVTILMPEFSMTEIDPLLLLFLSGERKVK